MILNRNGKHVSALIQSYSHKVCLLYLSFLFQLHYGEGLYANLLCFNGPSSLVSLYDQEQNINTGVVQEKPYKLKEFNAGSVKKKLDLPVQKNVLTKYFCIRGNVYYILLILCYIGLTLASTVILHA